MDPTDLSISVCRRTEAYYLLCHLLDSASTCLFCQPRIRCVVTVVAVRQQQTINLHIIKQLLHGILHIMQLAASLHKPKGQLDRRSVVNVKSSTSINELHMQPRLRTPFIPLSIFFTMVSAAFYLLPVAMVSLTPVRAPQRSISSRQYVLDRQQYSSSLHCSIPSSWQFNSIATAL